MAATAAAVGRQSEEMKEGQREGIIEMCPPLVHGPRTRSTYLLVRSIFQGRWSKNCLNVRCKNCLDGRTTKEFLAKGHFSFTMRPCCLPISLLLSFFRTAIRHHED